MTGKKGETSELEKIEKFDDREKLRIKNSIPLILNSKLPEELRKKLLAKITDDNDLSYITNNKNVTDDIKKLAQKMLGKIDVEKPKNIQPQVSTKKIETTPNKKDNTKDETNTEPANKNDSKNVTDPTPKKNEEEKKYTKEEIILNNFLKINKQKQKEALKKIINNIILTKIAYGGNFSSDIREIALDKITDNLALSNIITNENTPEKLIILALNKITNKNSLKNLIKKQGISEDTKKLILEKQKSQTFRYKIWRRFFKLKNNNNLTRTHNIYGDAKNRLSGNAKNIHGNITNIHGTINPKLNGQVTSKITGDISNVWGNIDGKTGDMTYVTGNLENLEKNSLKKLSLKDFKHIKDYKKNVLKILDIITQWNQPYIHPNTLRFREITKEILKGKLYKNEDTVLSDIKKILDELEVINTAISKEKNYKKENAIITVQKDFPYKPKYILDGEYYVIVDEELKKKYPTIYETVYQENISKEKKEPNESNEENNEEANETQEENEKQKPKKKLEEEKKIDQNKIIEFKKELKLIDKKLKFLNKISKKTEIVTLVTGGIGGAIGMAVSSNPLIMMSGVAASAFSSQLLISGSTILLNIRYNKTVDKIKKITKKK